ncbi:MAG: ATP-dependent helicase, partial [Dysgonamonadaceae bacterium]
MKLIDNINHKLGDELEKTIGRGSKLSIAAASFSIFAYQELKKELQAIDELRFIFTSPTFLREKTPKEKREFFIPQLTRERSLYGTEFEVRLRNELSQKAIARECAEWIRQRVRFKTNTTHDQMGGFIHLRQKEEMAYAPVNGFTTVDLGKEKGNQMFSLINRIAAPLSTQYLEVFNELWEDEERMQEVTDQVVEHISNVYRENAPEYIYFITLYNIFNEFLED